MSNRYSRQESIIGTSVLQRSYPLIVGVGAVGREVARVLSANGISKLAIIDMDTVEEHNCVTQGYHEGDVGKPKVEATSEEILRINSSIDILAVNDRWRPTETEFDVVFMCVDSLKIRELLFNYYESLDHVKLMLDSRIGGEQIRMLSVFDDESKTWFPQTLTDDYDAYATGCHVPMIKHSAHIAAGMLVQQFVAHLLERELFKDRIFALPSGELYNTDEP